MQIKLLQIQLKCGFWGHLSSSDRVEDAATHSTVGANLYITNATIWRQIYSGRRLLDLVTKLKYLKNLKLGNPLGIIIMQFGANNVGKTCLKRLFGILSQCKELFPNAKLVWFWTLPRRAWRFSTNTLSRNRTRIYRVVIITIVFLAGTYIKHPQFHTTRT